MQGVYAPGDRIYEARIAREFNVSRSPVREAIRVLEKEGLLIIDDKSKIWVYKPTLKDVEDIYQCRMALESLAARLTTEHATEKELQQIEETLHESKNHLAEGTAREKDALISSNGRFHDLIMLFSQNHRLQKQLNDLRSLTHYFRVINFQGEDRAKQIIDQHEQIFIHMKRRQENKAAVSMAEHIESDLRHLTQLIRHSTNNESK